MAVLDRFFSFWGQKKWLLVALDRWSSYTVTIVWELAWVDSASLDEWSSYRGGRLSRFDCNYNTNLQKYSVRLSEILTEFSRVKTYIKLLKI